MTDIEQAYRSFISAIIQHNKDGISAVLAPTITYNNQSLDRNSYLDLILKSTVTIEDIQIDMLAINNGAPAIASRLVNKQGSVEWPEYSFLHFNDASQIISVQTLADDATSSVPRTPQRENRNTATSTAENDMPSFYHAYIDSINTHTMAEHFPRFCQPQLTHNTRPLAIDTYWSFIETSFDEIEGLYFNVRDLVGDTKNQLVAARIEFTGRPRKVFRGVEPSGGEVKFWEHVLYRLEGGKIELVWSVLDMEAYKKCMGA